MSIYSRLAPDPWLNERNTSSIEALMRAYTSRSHPDVVRGNSNVKEVSLSRLAHEEAKYERELDSIRNFGHHWLKPIGMSKTMGQMQDEAREIQESFEEYEDEDNQFNQNNPEVLAGMEGQDVMSEEGPEHDEEEAPDLDGEIEEGASFDAEETSYVSSLAGHTNSPEGLRVMGGNDSNRGLSPAGNASLLSAGEDGFEDELEVEAGMSSAEEGSIGEYSSDNEGSNWASE